MAQCHATIDLLFDLLFASEFGRRIPQALTLFGIACCVRSGSELNPELTYAFELMHAFGLSHAFEAPRSQDLLDCHMLSEHRGSFGLTC